MFIDTHAHLDMDPLSVSCVVQSMKKDQLKAVIFVGVDEKSSKNAVLAAKENENVFASVGFHPQYAESWNEKIKKQLEKLAAMPKVVAFGEIGLDFHYQPFDKEKQKTVFFECLKIAKANALPVILHIRDANDEMIELLKKAKAENLLSGGVAHCFSGNADHVREYVNLGFFISFAGNFTYKKFDRNVVKVVPTNRLLVETDSPFLSPEPLRGKPNQPKNVFFTAKAMAEILNIDFETFQKLLEENTKRAFPLLSNYF